MERNESGPIASSSPTPPATRYGQPATGSFAIVFDLDNTLVHSAIDFKAIRREIIRMLDAHGVVRRPAPELAALAIPELIALGEAHDVLNRTALGPAMWEVVVRYETVGMMEARVEEDVHLTLQRLRGRSCLLAVLTNNARQVAVAALHRFGLLSYFHLVVTRDDIARLKPAPDGLELVRSRLGVRDLLLVGDSWIDGVAARDAGATFVALRPEEGDLEAHGVHPWRRIHRLADLLDLLPT